MQTKYRLRIVPAHDQDFVAVMLFRYTFDDAPIDAILPRNLLKQEYLSNDGWVEYASFDVLSDLPRIPGNELLDEPDGLDVLCTKAELIVARGLDTL